jgi:hypothetical protein
LDAGLSLGACWAGLTGRALRARLAGGPDGAGRTGYAITTGRTGDAVGTGRAGRTGHADAPLVALGADRAGKAGARRRRGRDDLLGALAGGTLAEFEELLVDEGIELDWQDYPDVRPY